MSTSEPPAAATAESAHAAEAAAVAELERDPELEAYLQVQAHLSQCGLGTSRVIGGVLSHHCHKGHVGDAGSAVQEQVNYDSVALTYGDSVRCSACCHPDWHPC